MEKIAVLDHGYVRFVEAWGHGDAGSSDMECGIIEAARQSTQGTFRGWEDDQKLLAFLFSGKPQHATPFEFSGMVVEVQAPIAVFREWHRHRVQSFEETGFNALDNLDDTAFNEMSARYAPLPDLNYLPTVTRILRDGGKNRQAQAASGADTLTPESAIWFRTRLAEKYGDDELLYQEALRRGVPKELARLCLPCGRYSRMRACTNLRNWLAFLTLRMDPSAMWEIQRYANGVGEIIAGQFPRTFSLFMGLRKS